MKKRLFHNMALLLCICLLVTMTPTVAHAKDHTGEGWDGIIFKGWHDMSKRIADVTVKNGNYEYFTGSTTSGFWSPADQICVKGKDTEANLFFYNCTIDLWDDALATPKVGSPIEILNGASVNIYIAGNCTFKGDRYGTAAIHKEEREGQLNIYLAPGATLNVTGGSGSAAIGGNTDHYNSSTVKRSYNGQDGYNIAIGGPGTLNAVCGINAPAIGGGKKGAAANISIGKVNTKEFPASDNASGIYHFGHIGGANSHFWGTRYGKYEDYNNVGLAQGKNQHMRTWIRGNGEIEVITYDAVLASTIVADDPLYEARVTYENCTKKWGNRKLSCTVCNKQYDTDTTPPVVGLNNGDKYTLINDEPLKFSVTDDKSGVAQVFYLAGKEKPVTLTAGSDGQYSLPIKQGTNYIVTTLDNAGNISTLPFHVRFVYTVNFIIDGKIVSSYELLEDEVLAEKDIPAIPKKDGYTDTDPHWDVNVLDANDIIAKANGSTVNVNAIYTANTHTVTYDENGQGTAPGAVTASFGSKIAAPPAPTAKGYLFGGWYKDSQCTDDWDFGVDTVAGDMTLYAKWTQCDHSGNTTPPSHTDITSCSACNGDIDPIGHTYDNEVVDTPYLKSLADCTHAMVYYKSCSCGASSEGQTGEATFTVGVAVGHIYDKEMVAEQYLKTPADCLNGAVYYRSCYCGVSGEGQNGDITFTSGSALGHFYSAEWEFDKDNHWHQCSRCGEKKDLSAHKWNVSAATEDQDKHCTVCGFVAQASVKTGDDSNMLLWLMIFLVSLSGLVAVGINKRRKGKGAK